MYPIKLEDKYRLKFRIAAVLWF